MKVTTVMGSHGVGDGNFSANKEEGGSFEGKGNPKGGDNDPGFM